jgi:hypothetical protein
MTTLSLLRPTFRGLPQPDDLYEVARAFVAANTVAEFNFFAPPFAVANWQQLHQQVPAPFHKTLHRCINWALRSFGADAERRLHATPEIAMDLRRAKTDRTDLRTTPYSLSRLLIYHYYASIVDTFGDEHARVALASGQLLLLGLRNSTSTLANKGRGLYDDSITVIKGSALTRNTETFLANTDPSAQYAQRAAPKPNGKKGERVDDRYSDVMKKFYADKKTGRRLPKNDGHDVNNDEILDAGRLQEGTYHYAEQRPHFLGDRAFRVGSRNGVRANHIAGPNQVAERDTDGDGLFTANDPSRIDTRHAGVSMLIHQGGVETNVEGNTWSAGCQTIPRNHYKRFLKHMPAAVNFYYVLVNAS